MSVTIDLPADLDQRLRERAIREGRTVEDLVTSAVRQMFGDASGPAGPAGPAELVEQWLSEPPNEEDARWPEVEAALGLSRDTTDHAVRW